MTLSDQIAERLFRQQQEREFFKPLRINEKAADTAIAYAVQDRLVELLKEDGLGRPVGYKVGLTSEAMQAFCGIQEPIIGHILESRVHKSSIEVPASDFVRLGVECELALLIEKSVPVLDENADPAQLLDYIKSVHASFELIEDRNADYGQVDAGSIIAENSWNAGIVVGNGSIPSELPRLDQLSGKLSVSGDHSENGMSSDVMGGPLNVLNWLARFLEGRGRVIQSGQWIMTGAIIPTIFPNVGETLCFEIEGLEPVSLTVIEEFS